MIKFRDIYEAIVGAEQAYERMGVDIDAAKCGMPKCVLTEAQENLLESYLDLSNVDIDFCDLDFDAIVKRIVECFQCVPDELSWMLPPPLPSPVYTVSNCTGTRFLPLEHIKRFRIYERTYTSPSIPSPVQVYLIPKEEMPRTFRPSVPENVSSNEEYHVSWNYQRNSLRVKVDHDKFPDQLGAPDKSFNINRIVAEIDDRFVEVYGITEVEACRALLMTPGVKWTTNHGLEKAIDGDPSTYTEVDGSPPEVVVEFMFAV